MGVPVSRAELGLESVSTNPTPVRLRNSAQGTAVATVAIDHAVLRNAIAISTASSLQGVGFGGRGEKECDKVEQLTIAKYLSQKFVVAQYLSHANTSQLLSFRKLTPMVCR